MRDAVLTKSDFYRRFYAGEFGNHGPMWRNLHEWRAARYFAPVAIRTLVRGGRCDYLIPHNEVESRYAEFLEVYSPEQLNISAQVPEKDKLLQGEVTVTEGGLSLFWSRDLEPMRIALAKDGRHSRGLAAKHLLESALNPVSMDWLNHLFAEYPGHVVEFTALRYNWGVLPGYNTVFWEVRLY